MYDEIVAQAINQTRSAAKKVIVVQSHDWTNSCGECDTAGISVTSPAKAERNKSYFNVDDTTSASLWWIAHTVEIIRRSFSQAPFKKEPV